VHKSRGEPRYPRLTAWCRSTLGQGVLGSLVLWTAMPPLDLGFLAWFAPIAWVLLIRRGELPPNPAIPASRFFWLLRGPYRSLWLAGTIFWLLAIYWLCLPHWATSFGWLAMALYMGLYLPVFVGLSRVAVHRLRVPVIVAAPVVWTGLELARAHVLTGFTMASLGHTQHNFIPLIQVSDLGGGYTVSFVVMFVAACLARMAPIEGERWTPRLLMPLVPLTAMLAAVLAYGCVRMSGPPAEAQAKIALIQGSIDVELNPTDDRGERVQDQYLALTRQALDDAAARGWKLDLIVWPETMFNGCLYLYDEDASPPPDYPYSPDYFRSRLPSYERASRETIADTVREFRVPMLLGMSTVWDRQDRRRLYNSAVLVDRTGEVLGHYDKMHLVMFGEYVPGGDTWPWLNRFTPLSATSSHGEKPAAFDVGGLRISPSICYETVIPHVIRRQVNEAAAAGREPDVLVNLTNDGWFWGSAELDMHLICGVFRAVECRKPMVIAANTGFSAWIDGDGVVRAQGGRRKQDVILADVAPDRRGSLYLQYGDWFSGTCLLACCVLAVVGYRISGTYCPPGDPNPKGSQPLAGGRA
jgi:apolipoprotein N-acyltransferase